MKTIKLFFLMTAMTLLLLLIGELIGGKSGVIVAFGISLVLNFGSYWFSDKIILATYRAQQVRRENTPEIYDIVERLSNKANLPMPKVYIINTATPNAFATGRNPQNAAVAVTTGILNVLNNEELEGVISHELGHVKNRDILISTIASTLVGSITFLARMAGWAFLLGGRDEEDGEGIASLILLILSPIVAILLQMSISRSREYLADSTGSAISGKPLALASALSKLSKANKIKPLRSADTASAHLFIVNPLKGKSLFSLFATHPPTEERIKRLQEIARGRRL